MLFVCWDCCDKMLKTRWLKRQTCCPTALEARSARSRPCSLERCQGRIRYSPFSSCWSFLGLWQHSSNLCMALSLCIWLSRCPMSTFIGTPITLGSDSSWWPHLNQFRLQWPYFPIRSHSEVLRVKIWTYEGVGVGETTQFHPRQAVWHREQSESPRVGARPAVVHPESRTHSADHFFTPLRSKTKLFSGNNPEMQWIGMMAGKETQAVTFSFAFMLKVWR